MTHPLIGKETPIIRGERNVEGRSITVTQPMSFGPAWELCKLGAKICRLAEPDTYIYIYTLNENSMAMMCVDSGYPLPNWTPTREELFANDYYLYPIKNRDNG